MLGVSMKWLSGNSKLSVKIWLCLQGWHKSLCRQQKGKGWGLLEELWEPNPAWLTQIITRMCIHQHFTWAGLFVLQEVENCSVERCRSLSRSPWSNAFPTERDTKLPFAFSLQRRASEKKKYSFWGREKALYRLVHTCMQKFWLWMCQIV